MAPAWASVPADGGLTHPGSFDDVLAMISGLERISFTGDPNVTATLDEHDPMGTWSSKTWDALAALSDYAMAITEGLASGRGRLSKQTHPTDSVLFRPIAMRATRARMCRTTLVSIGTEIASPRRGRPLGASFHGRAFQDRSVCG